MDLRLALLLLGVAIVILIFAISRYSHFFDKLLNKLRKNPPGRPKVKPHGSHWTRSAENAPTLGASQIEQSVADDYHEDRLFDFDADHVDGYQQVNEEPALIAEQQHTDTSNLQDHSMQAPEPTPEAELVHEEEAESLATLADNHAHSLRKPVGPFTSLRQIDYWIKLSPASPVTQAEILANLSDWGKINFPVQLHALTQEEPHWVDLLEEPGDTAIMDVVASYQLLDKGNAATIADLNTFDEQASKLGAALNAEKLMMATPEQALDQSLKLAHFFADSCEPLEVSICAPQGHAFMGKLVETSAKQQGLDFMDGDYVRQKRMASHNVILYRVVSSNFGRFDEDMSSNAQIECVKFTMMPVLSRTPGRDAKEMLDAVKAFASRVKGDIRVPGETEFHQDLLLKLRNRVSNLEKDIISAGLEPGGLEISRIFS